MSDTAITDQPSNRSIGRRNASTPGRITGRLRTALELMIWECKTDNEAAVTTGLTIHAIRQALKRPHVRMWFREQIEVLCTREGPANIHTLRAVRDQQDNQMARVQAVKELRAHQDEQQTTGSKAHSPGFVVIVQAPAMPAVLATRYPSVIDNAQTSVLPEDLRSDRLNTNQMIDQTPSPIDHPDSDDRGG